MESITFGSLGKYGWLGNQLFQMATCISQSIDNDCEIYFPEWPWSNRMGKLGKLCGSPVKPDAVTFEEKSFSYSEIPNLNGHINLHGYFQSDRYFDHNRSTIKSVIESEYIGYGGNSIQKLSLLLSDVCFIHVRRGDYLSLSHIYHIIGSDYYAESVRRMKDAGFSKFAVVTNDVEYCKRIFKGSEYIFFSGDQADDLSIMIACKGAIIANSSFSWWGSYLGDKSHVIAPSRWFNSGGPQSNSIYRENWTIVEA